MRLESGFWMAANWPWIRKKTMTSQFAAVMSSSDWCISLVKFSYWSKFHVNIMSIWYQSFLLWSLDNFRLWRIEKKSGNQKYLCLKKGFLEKILTLRNVVKWSDTLSKSCSKCYKIFKVCLIILRHCKV